MGRHVPFLKDREVVTSRCHGNKIPGSQETEVLQIWQKKKKENEQKMTCMHSFLCILGFHRSTMNMAVSAKILKFC